MMKKMIATLGLGVALSFASPNSAEAQQAPVVTGGLVNVTIVDAVDVQNVTLNLSAALLLAANVCGVAVNVLAADFVQDGRATCSTATQTVTLEQRRGGR